jgi:MarR family transcriptional regulator, organic hydroperoxide resistance regulator
MRKPVILLAMSATPDGRPDLAAIMWPLARGLMEAEEPVLAAHGITMWGYVVLNALTEQPLRTQAALAQAIGADKSRIIGVLDELQGQGLIDRYPDPADRRVHLLSLTAVGEERRAAVQAGIRRNEERILAHVPAADRAAFLRSLQLLAGLPPDALTQDTATSAGPRGRAPEQRGASA